MASAVTLRHRTTTCCSLQAWASVKAPRGLAFRQQQGDAGHHGAVLMLAHLTGMWNDLTGHQLCARKRAGSPIDCPHDHLKAKHSEIGSLLQGACF